MQKADLLLERFDLLLVTTTCEIVLLVPTPRKTSILAQLISTTNKTTEQVLKVWLLLAAQLLYGIQTMQLGSDESWGKRLSWLPKTSDGVGEIRGKEVLQMKAGDKILF